MIWKLKSPGIMILDSVMAISSLKEANSVVVYLNSTQIQPGSSNVLVVAILQKYSLLVEMY